MKIITPSTRVFSDQQTIDKVADYARELFLSVTDPYDRFCGALGKLFNRSDLRLNFVCVSPDDHRACSGRTNTSFVWLKDDIYAQLEHSGRALDLNTNFDPALLADPRCERINSHLSQALRLRYRVEQSQHDLLALRQIDLGYSGLSERRLNEGLKAFGLTRTEHHLAEQVFLGASPKAIADNRGVSVQTIRKQLQSLMRKTACASQEALVVLIYERCLHYQTFFSQTSFSQSSVCADSELNTQTQSLDNTAQWRVSNQVAASRCVTQSVAS